MSGKAPEDAPSSLVPTTHVGDQVEVPDPWLYSGPAPGFYGHLEHELVDRILFPPPSPFPSSASSFVQGCKENVYKE